jgi:hypothetical protein
MHQSSSFLAGDWYCSGCGDHQFAKNTSCRWCSTPKAKGASAELKDASAASTTRSKVIMRNPIVSHQKQRQPPTQQAFKVGDWYCHSCGDHQFAKNDHCRSCWAPRDASAPTGAESDVCVLDESSTDPSSQQLASGTSSLPDLDAVGLPPGLEVPLSKMDGIVDPPSKTPLLDLGDAGTPPGLEVSPMKPGDWFAPLRAYQECVADPEPPCGSALCCSYDVEQTVALSARAIPQGFQVLVRNMPEAVMSDTAVFALLLEGYFAPSLTGVCTRPGGKILLAFSSMSEAVRCVGFFHGQYICGAETPVTALFVRTVTKADDGTVRARGMSADAQAFVPSTSLSADATAAAQPVADDKTAERDRCFSQASTCQLSENAASEDSSSES